MTTDKDDVSPVTPVSADDQAQHLQGGLFTEHVGRLHTVDSAARLLGITEPEVRAGIQDRTLLAIELADGVIALPADQFGEDGLPLPGLRELSKALDPKGSDPLSIALILFHKSEYWDGATSAELMRSGRIDEVVAAAKRAHRSLDAP